MESGIGPRNVLNLWAVAAFLEGNARTKLWLHLLQRVTERLPRVQQCSVFLHEVTDTDFDNVGRDSVSSLGESAGHGDFDIDAEVQTKALVRQIDIDLAPFLKRFDGVLLQSGELVETGELHQANASIETVPAGVAGREVRNVQLFVWRQFVSFRPVLMFRNENLQPSAEYTYCSNHHTSYSSNCPNV